MKREKERTPQYCFNPFYVPNLNSTHLICYQLQNFWKTEFYVPDKRNTKATNEFNFKLIWLLFDIFVCKLARLLACLYWNIKSLLLFNSFCWMRTIESSRVHWLHHIAVDCTAFENRLFTSRYLEFRAYVTMAWTAVSTIPFDTHIYYWITFGSQMRKWLSSSQIHIAHVKSDL